jgi:hypothetical protein
VNSAGSKHEPFSIAALVNTQVVASINLRLPG